MTLRINRTAIFAAVLVLASGAASADVGWTLSPTESRVSFVSVKQGMTSEVHHFAEAEGAVSEQGNVSLSIDTASVETGVDVRDERMVDYLFQSAVFPTATLSMKVDMDELSEMEAGETRQISVTGSLSLVGQSGDIEAELLVSRLAEDKVLVATLQPVVVQAEAFELVAGIETLRELAELSSISAAVPVSALLVFVKN